jgi:uncharacterized protein YjdB
MSYIFASVRQIGLRWGWLVVCPLLAVCAGDNSSGPLVAGHPGAVSDLAVAATTELSAVLSFTQVEDGMGQPAQYDVRYSAGSMTWGTGTSASIGTCAVPVAGTGVGSKLSCTLFGLSPSTTYTFQVVAFRGTMNAAAVFGGLSNVATASTLAVTPTTPVATTVTVSPASVSMTIGTTSALQATVKDQNGNGMAAQPLTWSTSNAAVATVSAAGVVTGLAAGSATITAVSSNLSGTSTISVTSGPPPAPIVTTVTIAPGLAAVVAGGTTTLQATVKDQNGSPMTGQTVTWSSNNAAAATVSSNGLVTGIAAGSATITATSSGKSGTSSITVTAAPPPLPIVTTVTVAPPTASVVAGATLLLQATVKDQNGSTMSGQAITWSTNNPGIATVNSTGVVAGVAAGSAMITATTAGKSGTSNITITAPPPPPPPGGTILFQENFEDANLASRGWYDNTGVLLSTVEHVAGSNSSAQYRFLAGATTPTSGGSQRHKFTPSNSFYVSFYVKYSTNWVGSGQAYHPHEFYALSTLDGDFDGPSENFLDVYVEHNYQNGGRPRIAIQDNKSVNYGFGALPNNLIAVTEDRSVGGCNGVVEANITSECFNFGTYWYNDKQLTGPVVFQPNPGPGYKNNWNFVEAYFQLNTIVNGIGQADGVVQYWFNGTLIIDRHDILFRTGAHPTLQFSQFLIAPYIGDGSPVDQSMFVDNLRVVTSRIP